ncbi:MAG: chorismate synthase [Nitrospirota bacterium]
MLRFLTGGESHGRLLIGILEGIPAGLEIESGDIDKELRRRQKGYGRGERMKIERDAVEIVSGVRKGKTLGVPIALMIKNRDWDTWKEIMAIEGGEIKEEDIITRPRPGHADLPGGIKYSHKDIRNVLERASARETAMRVAIGAIAKRLLKEFGIFVISHVVEIGGIKASVKGLRKEKLLKAVENSVLRTSDKDAEERMVKKIDKAKKEGDTIGGVFEVIVTDPPVGLGSYSQWDRRVNARLAYTLMSIQGIKGVEIGMGFEASRMYGSEVHDEIFYRKGKGNGFYRKTNNAGGIEGGITNGQDIILRAAMKPIATLYKPLQSVDIVTKIPYKAGIERSDICAVPAASIVGEAVVAFEIASLIIEKFSGDSIGEMKRNYNEYMRYVREF